jgi:hypothetical protein
MACPNPFPPIEEEEEIMSQAWTDFPAALDSRDWLTRELKAYLLVLDQEARRVVRVFETSSLRHVSGRRLAETLSPLVRHLLGQYPSPRFDIAIARGALKSVRSEFSEFQGWENAKIEQVSLGPQRSP